MDEIEDLMCAFELAVRNEEVQNPKGLNSSYREKPLRDATREAREALVAAIEALIC
jgi:hypothetical protein